ncbi:hypothetical protein GLOTRDRAFT_126369 [Gloeophyllum trabeum ATCC 11539]|uniref:Uncharacterized protein n=1 Tax=Gloeophyllum trabeum (strain ATCC 11539 / FP-39264 / Madison 617) TaxID=670483 RepID=S7QDG5_GLOTA|nr:uncharacterized protein GLOTRDRAFT_126369 [Gloeophyllum trabeum ATCC 11539]EPQ57876.1 hypothetical protein GLOTRDRAFT_126369 [Gloeophyllum trabeum ATCC 11539]
MNFWQNADYVTLHTIGPNDRSWPEPVRSLSDRLEEPLPRWVYQGPHPCVAPFARSLSAELLQRRSLLSGTTDSECYDAPDDDLSRLFDAAISATATARSLLLAESERPCASNSKEFLLAGLVSHVVTLTAPQALVLERPSFVLPRHPKTLWNPLRKYMKTTSTATLLVGCIPEGFRARLGEGEEGETTTSGVDESPCDLREYPPRRMTMEEFINGRYYDDESESDSSDGGSGDKTSCVPDEAPMNDSDEKDEDPFLALHMLATPSPWDTPVIPAICMAGPGEIYALMASTLYQRRVWRVQEPLIGLMFPPTGTAAQLIFGWLEDDESIEDALPSVHLAFQDATLNASAQTVFDICDPGSTLKLCLLLSNLTRTYIDHLRQTASDSLDGVLEGAKKGHSLRWRLDLTRDESEDDGWRSTEGRITAWAREVAILMQVPKNA